MESGGAIKSEPRGGFLGIGIRIHEEPIMVDSYLKTQMDEAIFRRVPIGEENAATARLIWRQIDMGTIAGVKFKLNRMVSRGILERRRVPTHAAETSYYFRSTTRDAVHPVGHQGPDSRSTKRVVRTRQSFLDDHGRAVGVDGSAEDL